LVDLHGDLLDGFGEADADFVLYGHTDHQLAQRLGRVLVGRSRSGGAVLSPSSRGKTVLDRIAPTQADETRTRAVVMPWLAQARAAESTWLSEASGRASGKSSSS